MNAWEVTLVFRADAGDAAEAEALAREAAEGLGAEAVSVEVRDLGPAVPATAVMPEECLRSFGLDPWGILSGERLDCFLMGGEDEDSREARVSPARGLLCVRWHTRVFGTPDARDEALESGSFCGGTWRRDAGYKAFYYLKEA